MSNFRYCGLLVADVTNKFCYNAATISTSPPYRRVYILTIKGKIIALVRLMCVKNFFVIDVFKV